jgi:thiamine pyrophosphokinase
MASFAILMGGDVLATPRLRAQLDGARVIAADSGMRHAAILGLEPELWVGDFDSATAELIDAHAHIRRQVHPPDKDATDGELAVNEALARGADRIVFAGGLGGQMDHVTAHLALMLTLAKRGIAVFASSGSEEAYPLIAGERAIALCAGDRISIVPWSPCEGFSISGVTWPLADRDLALGSSFTLSNVALGSVQLHLRSGAGIVFAYPA